MVRFKTRNLCHGKVPGSVQHYGLRVTPLPDLFRFTQYFYRNIFDLEFEMAQYAIAFDLDTKAMKNDGISATQRTNIYQTEIPDALASCGFTAHPQGSLYHTESEQNPITAIMQLQSALKDNAPRFCKYVSRVHVFRMEEWSDVTELISEANVPSASPPTAEEELAEQEDIDAAEVV